MQKLTRADLMSLEQYAVERNRLRTEVIAHKLIRNVQVGPNMTWCFEDRSQSAGSARSSSIRPGCSARA